MELMEQLIRPKPCSKCKKIKKLTDFNKCKRHFDGLQYTCKLCEKERRQTPQYKQSHKIAQAKSRSKPEIKEQRKRYAQESMIYREYHRNYERIRRSEDIQFRLATNLRSRLGIIIRNNLKSGSAIKDLGCSVAELKIYLESKFQLGMTWENHGRRGWHIDHIIPLSSFDLTDREQFLKACHYTNLQPLWALQNLQKGNKVA